MSFNMPKLFGIFRPKKELSEALFDRINAVAREQGAKLYGGDIPGTGIQYWFSCRSLGEPFDTRTAKAVYFSLAEAEINVRKL